jgi:hypothetical protein
MQNQLPSTTKLSEIVPPVYASQLSTVIMNADVSVVGSILNGGPIPTGSGITQADVTALTTVREEMIQLVRWMTSGAYWTTA